MPTLHQDGTSMTLPSSLFGRRKAALAGALASLIAAPALAQPAAAPPTPAAPAVVPAAPLPRETPDPLRAALSPVPGGLTPDQVGARAVSTSYSMRARQEELRTAQARVDQAATGYFPRLTLAATYTRLSEVENGLDTGGGASVGAANEGPIGVCTNLLFSGLVCDQGGAGSPIGARVVSFDFPSPLNSYAFTAQLIVPISDYVLRISQSYASASHAESAKRRELEGQARQAAADAKIAYFNWVRAKGQVVVASEAVAQTHGHVEDARQTFQVGLISRADVLRIEAQLAAAEQTEVEAKAFAEVAETQLRALLHAKEGEALAIGVDVFDVPPAPPSASLEALTREAFESRAEIRALDETVYSLREVERVTRASYLPRLDAFADANYANPNQRIFPSREEFDLTWDAGLRLSWTVNDTLAASGASAEARARTAGVVAQKEALRDALRIEVASAYADLQKAPAAMAAADRGVVAAEESLRVRRELFRNGKATGVDLADAEAELTRARLRRIDAHLGLLVAKTRLARATGRDAAPTLAR
jgi:outer membrane protein TolC